MNRVALWIATVGPLGLHAPAPATTVGSAAALVTYIVLLGAPGVAGAPLGAWLGVLGAAFVLAATLVGIWASGVAERAYGHDASPIVVDEVVGMWVSLLFITPSVTAGLVAFFLFRVFDIVKPFPAGRAQNLPGGWGVVMDDVLAGVYANVATRLVLHFVG